MDFGLAQQLLDYKRSFPREALKTDGFLDFLKENQIRSFSRGNQLGHFTASVWLLSPDFTKVLLTHHRKLNIWVQLGGHIDEGESPLSAAIRETKEESGISDLQVITRELFDIDQHRIPHSGSEPEHFHFDLRYLVRSNSTSFEVSSESKELAWFSIKEGFFPTKEESVLRMLKKTKTFLEDHKHNSSLFFNTRISENTVNA